MLTCCSTENIFSDNLDGTQKTTNEGSINQTGKYLAEPH
jgi:hypothetical protein